MSSDGFHVHGPHDHELEHAGQADPGGLGGKLAVITAILATVGAMFSYMGGNTQANAGLYKNDAAIKKTEAANQWSLYQSKSNKQNMAELAVALVSDDKKPKYQQEVERYKLEKGDIKLAAEKLEKQSTDFDEMSAAQMHQHHRWAQATTALQVSIALAAIALLTKKRWMAYATLALGAVGFVVGGLAALHL